MNKIESVTNARSEMSEKRLASIDFALACSPQPHPLVPYSQLCPQSSRPSPPWPKNISAQPNLTSTLPPEPSSPHIPLNNRRPGCGDGVHTFKIKFAFRFLHSCHSQNRMIQPISLRQHNTLLWGQLQVLLRHCGTVAPENTQQRCIRQTCS